MRQILCQGCWRRQAGREEEEGAIGERGRWTDTREARLEKSAVLVPDEGATPHPRNQNTAAATTMCGLFERVRAYPRVLCFAKRFQKR